MNRDLRGQSVAQCVQYGSQCNVGVMPVKLKLLGDGLEPDIGFLNGTIEDRDARCAH